MNLIVLILILSCGWVLGSAFLIYIACRMSGKISQAEQRRE